MIKKQKIKVSIADINEALVQSSQDIIFVIDADFTVQFVNKSAEKFIGMEAKKIVGKPVKSLFPPPIAQQYVTSIKTVLESGKNKYYESKTRVDDKDGWLSTTLTPLRSNKKIYAVMGVSRDITELKNAHEDIISSEKKYRLLAENATDVVWKINLPSLDKIFLLLNSKRPDFNRLKRLIKMKYSYVTPSVLRQQGYTQEEFLKLEVKDVVTPQSYTWIQSLLLEELMIETKKSFDPDRSRSIEFEAVHKDGHSYFVEALMKFLRDEHGAPIAITGATRDISKQKEIWQSLEENKAKFKTLVESSPDCIKLLDLKGNTLYLSPGGLLEHNLKPNQVHKWQARSTIAKNSLKLFDETFQKAVSGETATVDVEHKPKTANRTWCELTLSPIKDSNNNVVNIFGLSRDLTERKKNHESLLIFKLGFEQSSDAIFMTNIDGDITFVNPGFEKAYGWKEAEILGKKPRLWKTDRHDKTFYKNFWKKILAGQTAEVEFTNKTRNGEEIIMQSAVSPIVDEGKIIGFLAIQKDVTGIRAAEDMLKKQVKQMELMGKLNLKRHKKMLALEKKVKQLKSKLMDES